MFPTILNGWSVHKLLQHVILAVMMVLLNEPTTRTKLGDASQHHYQLTWCLLPPRSTLTDCNVTYFTFSFWQWPGHSHLRGQQHAWMFLNIVWCLWWCRGLPSCGGFLLTIFLFLLQQIDTTLKGVHLLLTMIYNHMKYGNAHLQMADNGTLLSPSTLLSYPSGGHWHLLRGVIIARMIKEMTLMNISVYCTSLNKLTGQMIKLNLPSYMLIITGLSGLQHKNRRNVIHMCTHIWWAFIIKSELIIIPGHLEITLHLSCQKPKSSFNFISFMVICI